MINDILKQFVDISKTYKKCESYNKLLHIEHTAEKCSKCEKTVGNNKINILLGLMSISVALLIQLYLYFIYYTESIFGISVLLIFTSMILFFKDKTEKGTKLIYLTIPLFLLIIVLDEYNII